MSKLYNTENILVKELNKFFENLPCNIYKPQLKMLPHFLTSIIKAENITTLDISKVYVDSSFLTNNSSVQKKIWRFLNNSRFNANLLYKSFIKYVISNLKSIKHNKLTIIMDHMFTKNRFVTLMFSLKVGTQSIPIWFKSDKTKEYRVTDLDKENSPHLFKEKTIFNAIDEIHELFKDFKAKITFLGDRWFSNLKLMKHIQDLGHHFCIRTKVNSSIRFLIYDKKEKHKIYKHFYELPIQKHHSLYYENVPFGRLNFKCNLSTSRGISTDDPWFILSNIEPNKAIREYSHRFGGIETLFKNQKTNGFNLEKTKIRNLHAFENLYALICMACTWLVIIGSDYTKNYQKVKHKLNIRFVKKIHNKTTRILSLFNLGLTIFRSVYNSFIDYKIKCNMQLYL